MEKTTKGKALVKYMHRSQDDAGTEETIASYWTDEPNKVLQFYTTLFKENIFVTFNSYSENVSDKWKSDMCLIDDIDVQLETDSDLMVINVWIV